jgi:V8-like Glu-specific endopeptidase
MTAIDEMKDVTVGQLLGELRRREAPEAERLTDVETPALVAALLDKEKVIYGVDDRKDMFQVTNDKIRRDADCVAALFSSSQVVDNGDGTVNITTSNFGTAFNLCATERFRNQPIGAFCSGFFVGKDLIVTAGHCVSAANVADTWFVFGFRMKDATTPPKARLEAYRGKEVVGRTVDPNGADYALVRLTRKVANHKAAKIREAGKIKNNQQLHVIGHPSGLPTKYAGGATVRDNNPGKFFVANLDTYGGNSGSPVFNSRTHKVEGILVRGETDFVSNGTCIVTKVCPTTGCRGEDCTRITELSDLIDDLLEDEDDDD